MLISSNQLLYIILALFNLASFSAISSVSEMQLDDKIEAQLSLTAFDINALPVEIELEITLKNITKQALEYQHKDINIMATILVFDEQGRQLNSDEIKIRRKARNEPALLSLKLEANSIAKFSRMYKVKNYFDSHKNIEAVYLQALIVLLSSNDKKLQYGFLRTAKVKFIEKN